MKEILAIDAKKCTGYSIPIGMFEKVVQVIVYQLVFLKKQFELQKTTKSKAKNGVDYMYTD